jgi:hypothetical protein
MDELARVVRGVILGLVLGSVLVRLGRRRDLTFT